MARIPGLFFLLILGPRFCAAAQETSPAPGVSISLPVTPQVLAIAIIILIAANVLFFVWLMRLGRRKDQPIVTPAPPPHVTHAQQSAAPGRFMEISMVMEDPMAETREALAEMLQRLSVSVHSFMEKNESYTQRLIDHQSSLQEAIHQEQIEQIKTYLMDELKKMQVSSTSYRGDLEENSERLIREQERVREIQAAADLDPLTKVLNRASILKALKTQYDRARDMEIPFCLILIGIDKFDMFTSQYGEDTAHKMLQVVAHVMKEKIRPADQIGLLGEDVFAVVMPETSAEQARYAARDLLAAVNRSYLKHGGEEIGVTVSIAAGQAEAAAGESAKAFIERLYETVCKVRQAGGNDIALAPPRSAHSAPPASAE